MIKNLEKYLNEETIQSNIKTKDWKDAVTLGSKPLLEKEYINKTYIEAMINAVEEHGPYMVLADNFALMHARPEDGVNETSMSLLVSENKLDMKGKSVKLFLVLAASDDNSHIEALSEITELLSNPVNFEVFMRGNKKEILELIKGGE